MSTFIAFYDHYANLLNDYAERKGYTIEKSLNKLNTALKIERRYDGTYDAYDANNDFICEVELGLLAPYEDYATGIPSIIKTNVEDLLDCSLAEVVDFDESSLPHTAAQILTIINEFEQALEAEKAKYIVGISTITRHFASNIYVKKVGWEFEITCDSYLLNPAILGCGDLPFTWCVEPNEQVKQVLKNNTFVSGGIEEFKELLVIAARPGKFNALTS